MASAAASYHQPVEQSTILKIGNLRFCRGCKNLMIVQSDDNSLIWKCSIECPYNQQVQTVLPESTGQPANLSKSRLVILAQVADTDFNSDQNIQNQFTPLDPTLLRTKLICPNVTNPKHVEFPTQRSEMIIFKQNLVTAKSYYICTVCHQNINIDGKTVQ